MHRNQLLGVHLPIIVFKKFIAEFDTGSSEITTREVHYNHV